MPSSMASTRRPSCEARRSSLAGSFSRPASSQERFRAAKRTCGRHTPCGCPVPRRARTTTLWSVGASRSAAARPMASSVWPSSTGTASARRITAPETSSSRPRMRSASSAVTAPAGASANTRSSAAVATAADAATNRTHRMFFFIGRLLIERRLCISEKIGFRNPFRKLPRPAPGRFSSSRSSRSASCSPWSGTPGNRRRRGRGRRNGSPCGSRTPRARNSPRRRSI